MASWNSFQENYGTLKKSDLEYHGTVNPMLGRWKGIFLVILLGALVALGAVTYVLFHSFSSVILSTHTNQLSTITESAANNLEIYLHGFEAELESLLEIEQFREAEESCQRGDYASMDVFLEEAISARTDEMVYIRYYLAPMGYCAAAGDETREFYLAKVLGSDETFQMITIVKDQDGEYYFCVGAESAAGGWLFVYVSMRNVFEKTSGYIRMGENGYIMYKDSDGMILMHPVDEQIGIDVLADRKIMHPDFDFSELEVLIEHQLAGQTGVEVYHSYWWGNENPTKVMKVSAYQPLYLGSDFIVVSSVIDYSEVAGQIQSHAATMVMIVAAMVIVFLLLMFGLWQSLKRQNQTAQENARLIAINENLEKLRQEEELLAHEQRLQLVGTMTSGIAHEFNNLLTPIMGYSSLILSGMSEEDENYEDMQAIYDSAEKAKEIISRINQFSGKNAEKMMSPIHVAEVLEKSLVITEAVKRRHIRMVTEIEREHDICMGNPTQIQQMVINLCNNALQAMGDEPGTLTVTSQVVGAVDKENVFFRGKEHRHFYQITVQDTGCGMDQETMSQMFVPFFTTKRPGEGTGLGMSVVQRMVDAHQGLLCAESEVGVGTTFRIFLPLLEETGVDLVEPS